MLSERKTGHWGLRGELTAEYAVAYWGDVVLLQGPGELENILEGSDTVFHGKPDRVAQDVRAIALDNIRMVHRGYEIDLLADFLPVLMESMRGVRKEQEWQQGAGSREVKVAGVSVRIQEPKGTTITDLCIF